MHLLLILCGLQLFLAGHFALPTPPFCSFSSSSVSSTSSVSKDGITYTFDKAYTAGQYITGDYWVVGPVNIVSISPEVTSTGENGWMINPPVGQQALDSRGDYYDKSLLPNLPATVAPGSSVVKIISAAKVPILALNTSVLSVVSEIPPNNGAYSLRPPYINTKNKISYSIDSIDFGQLPNLSLSTGNPPSFASFIPQLQIPLLDFLPNFNTGEFMPSFLGDFNYGAVIQSTTTPAVIRSMYSDAAQSAESVCAMALLMQYGVDTSFNLIAGNGWPRNGGWANGRKLPASFAAFLLNATDLQEAIQNSGPGGFGENDDGDLWIGVNTVIWGNSGCGIGFHVPTDEEGYWKMITAPVADQDYHGGCKDPYGYIDGGQWPGTKYQGCCTSQPFSCETIALRLMPSLQPIMNVSNMMTYGTRWMNVGVWTSPDPCAPATGICSGGTKNGNPCSTAEVDATGGPCRAGGGFCAFNTSLLGVTFGPDGQGSCIKGSGRFPLLHGFEKSGGDYPIPWVDALWPVVNPSILEQASNKIMIN